MNTDRSKEAPIRPNYSNKPRDIKNLDEFMGSYNVKGRGLVIELESNMAGFVIGDEVNFKGDIYTVHSIECTTRDSSISLVLGTPHGEEQESR